MKDQKIWAVINTVLALEVSKGHLKWKVSDLSRMTRMNRSLIYYYLGKTKQEIFSNSLLQAAEDFYGLSESRMKMVREGRLMECFLLTRKMFRENPDFIVFYFKWRMRKGFIQDQLIELEKRYQRKLKGLFKDWDDSDILAFQALMQGVVSSPFLTEDVFEKAVAMIRMPGKGTK